MIIGSVALSYEQACDIAGIPYDRGYVTLSEVTDKLNEIMGLDLLGSEQIGWVEDCEQNIKHLDVVSFAEKVN